MVLRVTRRVESGHFEITNLEGILVLQLWSGARSAFVIRCSASAEPHEMVGSRGFVGSSIDFGVLVILDESLVAARVVVVMVTERTNRRSAHVSTRRVREHSRSQEVLSDLDAFLLGSSLELDRVVGIEHGCFARRLILENVPTERS